MTIHDGYGQAETNIVVANGAEAGFKPGSLGRAVPGHHVAIIDGEGNELPVGIEGDLAVRGRPPTLFAGYWESPDETKAAFRGDWYLTGDVAMADEDGFIWFVGRAEDVITSRGRNFGPYEVERILRGHDAIAASAVIGLRDLQRGGQFVRAYVVPRPGSEGSEQLQAELRQFVGQALPEQQVPREIVFVDELPTVGGKVNRHALRERPVSGRPLWDLPPTSDLEPDAPPMTTAPEPTSAPPAVAEAAPLVQPQPIVAPEPEPVVPATPEPVAEAAPTHAPEWEVVVEPAPIRAPEPAPEREPEHVETTSTREPQWEPIDDGAPLRAPEPDPVRHTGASSHAGARRRSRPRSRADARAGPGSCFRARTRRSAGTRADHRGSSRSPWRKRRCPSQNHPLLSPSPWRKPCPWRSRSSRSSRSRPRLTYSRYPSPRTSPSSASCRNPNRCPSSSPSQQATRGLSQSRIPSISRLRRKPPNRFPTSSSSPDRRLSDLLRPLLPSPSRSPISARFPTTSSTRPSHRLQPRRRNARRLRRHRSHSSRSQPSPLPTNHPRPPQA